MWISHYDTLADGHMIRVAIANGQDPLTYAEVIQHWQDDAEFRAFFPHLLADCPFRAFRWETPSLTLAIAHRPFEFVWINSPSLERVPDPHAFADQFRRSQDSILKFPNLGQDAVLIVPRLQGENESAYVHLGAFVRQGDFQQNQELWQTVGNAMAHRLSQRPVWLSTAGGGVAWLHIRLDDRPKYYRYSPYRSPQTVELPKS